MDDHGWSIPIPALVQLGLLDRVSPPDTPSNQAVSPPVSPPGVTPSNPLPRDDQDAIADLRVEVEKERGLRIAAEREVQAITAHLATAQNTIRMIEAAPPKIETRVERVEVPVVERVEVPVPRRVEVPVEVPVVPRSLWTVLTVLLLALAALIVWTFFGRSDHDAAPVHPPTTATAPPVGSEPVVSVTTWASSPAPSTPAP